MDSKKIVLGTVQLGIDYGINNKAGKPSKQLAYTILETAWEKGISILDTADAYGDAQTLIGEYHKLSNTVFEVNSKFKGNAINISSQLERTLNELRIDSLNCYFYHDFNDFVNKPNLIQELIALKEKGKFKQIGLSVYENSELELAISNPHIDFIQLPFNLFDNINERGILLQEAKKQQKIIQVRSIYLQGLFFKEPQALPIKLAPLSPYLDQIHEIAKTYRLTIEELAIAYVMLQKQIDEIIIGVDNPDQLKVNLEMFGKEFDPLLRNEIEKITVEEKELLYPKNWN
ncbi:aldo/keto reductase [Pedobacter sp. UC225_65]|uniref:aldo/keto reductase n=1 Tax=Pedobacter sp. UC225_65 TaxID=3350173 RepID=UPI0036700EE8